MSKSRECPLLTSRQSPTVGYNYYSGENISCKSTASKFQDIAQNQKILYSILVNQMDEKSLQSNGNSGNIYEPSRSSSNRSSPENNAQVYTSDGSSMPPQLPTLGDILSGYSSSLPLKNPAYRNWLAQLRKRSEGDTKSHTYQNNSNTKLMHTLTNGRQNSLSSDGVEYMQEDCGSSTGSRIPDVHVTEMNVDIARDSESSDNSSTSTDDISISSHCSSADMLHSSSVTGRSSEELVEQARSKLMRLSTTTANGSMPQFCPARSAISVAAVKSLSHPGTPPSPQSYYQEPRRKYSMGNQDLRHQRQKRLGVNGPARFNGLEGDPVDLSVKRKRSEPAMNELSSEDSDSSSILRSALRGRSSTFSFGGRVPDPVTAGVNGLSGGLSTGSQDSLTSSGSNFNSRMRVTLAKRNLNPVKSRVLDRIHAMVSFVADLPEFSSLPINDQMALLSSAAHRLLLLFMAESNLEFAVTSVQLDDKQEIVGAKGSEEMADLGSEGQQGEGMEMGAMGRQKRRLEAPTVQFVEGIQNFISKCHSIGIRPSEYFFMRWIVLFHAGANKLERGDVVSNLNTAARQDLQEIITDSHPNDKLRYSKLLLTLHTVFGVNCAMLESLFCAPLQLAGGLESFACRLLRAYQERNCAVVVAAAAAANGGKSKVAAET